MKDTRKLIQNKTEIGFQEAVKNFTQFDEKMATYKKSVSNWTKCFLIFVYQSNNKQFEDSHFILLQNFETAKTWINNNCPKCEQDKFNESTVSECFLNDDKIQKINSEFNNYMGCIVQMMLDLKTPNQDLDSNFEAFEEQERLLKQNNLGRKVLRVKNKIYFSVVKHELI